MKTLIFIERRRFDIYHFSSSDTNNIRKVAIVAENSMTQLSATDRDYFDDVYMVPLQQGVDLFAKLKLDRDAVAKIVANEIALASGAEQVGFVCNDEFNLVLVGWLRDHFHIPGAGKDQYNRYRNKDEMKDCLRQQGLRVPNYLLLSHDKPDNDLTSYYQQLVLALGQPFVVKPLSGAGAVQTEIIDSEQAFCQFYQLVRQSSFAYEAEEFIRGKLFHCDSIVQNGSILFSATCEYLYPAIDFAKGELGTTLFIPADSAISQRIADFNRQALAALGYIDGTTHLEIFQHDNGELVFVEVAARAPGGEILTAYHHMFDFCWGAVDIAIQSGQSINIIDKPIAQYCFAGRIPYRPGIVDTLYAPEIDSQCQLQWKIAPGDVIDHYSSNIVDYCGSFIVTNTDYQQLAKDFDKLRHYQAYQVVSQ